MIQARVDKTMLWEKGVTVLVPELQAGDAEESSSLGLFLPSWAEVWMQRDEPAHSILSRSCVSRGNSERDWERGDIFLLLLLLQRDADGGCMLPCVMCHLVWDQKRCSQLRYPAGNVVSQITNPVGAWLRDIPKWRGAVRQEGKRVESPTSCLGRGGI